MIFRPFGSVLALFVTSALIAVGETPLLGQEEPPAGNGAVEVLTRGPIHEAFAEPLQAEQGRKAIIVAKQPPQPIEELPPEEKPAGDNVQWIGGYWAWDDDLKDFLWVAGIWRQIPPGRQWVPGYWSLVAGGFQWTPGFWASTQSTITYLPQPPEPVQEAIPPQVGDDDFWVPGVYKYVDNRYRWRAGYWHDVDPNWIWVSAHYQWTPSGYVFIDGYWDYPIDTRGVIFAPICYREPIYLEPNYVYLPTVAIDTNLLTAHLFARPDYCHYYFGDYYAASYLDAGIYPWFRAHSYTRVGYDPLFSYYRWKNSRHDRNWAATLSDRYAYLQLHSEYRPPHTLVQQNTYVKNNINIFNNTVVNTITANNTVNRAVLAQNVLAAPIKQMAASGNSAMQFERLRHEDRARLQRDAATTRQFAQKRAKDEGTGHHAASQIGFGPAGVTGGSATHPIAPPGSAKTDLPKLTPQTIGPNDVIRRSGGSDRLLQGGPAATVRPNLPGQNQTGISPLDARNSGVSKSFLGASSGTPPATTGSQRNSDISGKNNIAIPSPSKPVPPPSLGKPTRQLDLGSSAPQPDHRNHPFDPNTGGNPRTSNPAASTTFGQAGPAGGQNPFNHTPRIDVAPGHQPHGEIAKPQNPLELSKSAPKVDRTPNPKSDRGPKVDFTPKSRPKIDTTPKFTPQPKPQPQIKIDHTPKIKPQPQVRPAPQRTPNPGKSGGNDPRDKNKRPK